MSDKTRPTKGKGKEEKKEEKKEKEENKFPTPPFSTEGQGEGEASPPPFSNQGNTVYTNTEPRRAETGEGEQVPYSPLLESREYSMCEYRAS